MGSSSGMYEGEDGLFHGPMPVRGQVRTEEIRTEGTAVPRPKMGEPSGRDATPQVVTGQGNEDEMSAMINIMADMMYQLREVLSQQNRAGVERSPPRPHYRVAQEVPPSGSVTPVKEPELRGPVMERLDMRAFNEMRLPAFRVERDYQVVNNWIYQMEKIFKCMQCPEEQMVPYATYVLEGDAGGWWRAKWMNLPYRGQELTWADFLDRFLQVYALGAREDVSGGVRHQILIFGTIYAMGTDESTGDNLPSIRRGLAPLKTVEYGDILDRARMIEREEEEQDRIREKRKGAQVGGQNRKPKVGTDRPAPVKKGACY
ncbi:hypothetical protein ACLOJK_004820 [Asimina triloba]